MPRIVRLLPLVFVIGAAVLLIASGSGVLMRIALIAVTVVWTLTVRGQTSS